MEIDRKYIVTTTINPPTEAIERFDALRDWTLIVVGDRRTPSEFRLKNGIYLSPDDQERLAPELSGLIGWNCVQRRNLGFVLALDLGANLVATIDDDNIPYDSWGSNLMVGRTVNLKTYEAENGCFDPLGATEHGHLWHRGYPLQLLRSRNYSRFEVRAVRVDVQADLWDGDPDVDAVCRLEHAPDVQFDPSRFPFASSAVSPFDSQNTFVGRDALSRYFMIPGVGRMDDIWAAFHLQSLGFKAAYGAPTVRQIRNPHNVTRDLVDELLGYQHSAGLVAAINSGTYRAADFWPERARLAYDAYLRRIGA
jgi:hypothetical protein